MPFSEQQKVFFVQTAQTEGLQGAMELLGYPNSKTTGIKWIEQFGVEISKSSLHKRAAEIGHFYTERQKIAALQDMLDAIYAHVERINTGFGMGFAGGLPDPGDLAKLASAAEKIIKTIELLEGRVTERTEAHSIDSTDLELRTLIAEAQSEAAAKEAALREGEPDEQAGDSSDVDEGDGEVLAEGVHDDITAG